jgi:hypothetical protein
MDSISFPKRLCLVDNAGVSLGKILRCPQQARTPAQNQADGTAAFEAVAAFVDHPITDRALTNTRVETASLGETHSLLVALAPFEVEVRALFERKTP